MKERQIKVWPETVDYLPSVSQFQRLAGKNNIRIDFSECRHVSSTGLTVLLLRLLNLLYGGRRRKWASDNPDRNPVFDTAKQLGFFNHLNRYGTNASLWAPATESLSLLEPVSHQSVYGSKITSFPIRRIGFTDYSDRRTPVNAFRKEVYKSLLNLESSYSIHANHLTSVFQEMAKNSADHTEGDAFFGMDLIGIPERRSVELRFVLGDLGKGIKQHIQDHLPENIKLKRWKFMSLYESYYHALKRGYTSTPQNQKNKGIGMSIILDLAKSEALSLSVFDAESRGILSSLENDNITHEQLRKHFIAFTKDRIFYYYGSVESEVL